MYNTPKIALVALAAAAVSTAALAGSHASELPAAVKARKAHMQLYAHNIGILSGMARGNAEYDAEAAVAAASNLADLSHIDETSYWVAGTDSETVEGSRALPVMFENLDDVQVKIDALHTASMALTETAGNGLEALQAGIGAVGGACGACHKAYQVPNE